MNHPFDAAIALEAAGEGLSRGRTSAAYANVIGPFGGITAAQVLNAVLQDPRRLGEPVSLTVNYCAAVADGPFDAHARPLRTNRSTQHWFVELVQDGQTVISATAVTAVRRDTWADVEHRPPPVPPPADVPRATLRARVAWLDRYEMRFVEGGIPARFDGSGDRDSRSLLWIRDDPPRPLDHASLAAMADNFFPRIWRRRASLVPIGTVSITVYFHADAAQMQATGSGHLLGQAQAQAFRGGYFDHTAQLWNEAGDLLATSHQVVYFKD